MNKDDEIINSTDDSAPPIFKSWNKIYGFVFFTLVFLIFLFYLFTKAFE